MKNLTRPTGSFLKQLDSIVKSKKSFNKSRLTSMSADIRARYREYCKAYLKDELEVITQVNYSQFDHRVLQGCYSSSTKALQELLLEIKSLIPTLARGTCPFCGIKEPNTVEHILPQTLFPEFSVLALNLIPCCFDCNSKKGDRWLRNGIRSTINFYLDHIPQIQFLFCKVDFSDGDGIPKIKYNLNFPACINGRTKNLIDNHYEHLELCERFIEFIGNKIDDKKRSQISYLNSDNRLEVQKGLIREADRLSNKYGVNHWDSVLTFELSKNTAYLDLVQEGIMHEQL